MGPHFRFRSMARSSSPVFNEAPPAADPAEPMVTKTSTSSSAPADASVSSASATPTATASSTVVATTSAPSPSSSSDCLKASGGAASPSSVDASPDASASPSDARYPRVPPTVLQSVQASLTFRKSCLKRSKSSVLPPSSFSENNAVAKTVEKPPVKDTKPVQKNRRRCWECKMKVGLTAVKCRCDYTFCNKHRYAEEHKCVFNFKTAGKRKLEEENPVVVPCKVARIN
ncbi:hypothetical protein PRNP1_006047 [Phytophthora ramorum]